MACLFALFAWWFSTGAILLAVRRWDRCEADMRGLVVAGVPFAVFGAIAAAAAAEMATVGGIYLGFVAALSLWGFVELTFLAGVITGPNRQPLAKGARGSARFRAAWAVVAWHEIALVSVLAALVWMADGAQNAMAAWTFGTLWVARVLAKLNLFLGVPGINIEAVPRTLAHIPSYFRQADPSWLFPPTILILSLATAMWVSRLFAAPTPEAAATYGLLAALTALALIEHWMMLLPAADTRLWRWLMALAASRAQDTKTTIRLEQG